MISETPRGLGLLRTLGALIALAATLFVHMVARIYAGHDGVPASGVVNGWWVAAPLVLYGVALAASLLLGWLHSLRAAKAAAFAGLVWPLCVLMGLVLNVHFVIPAFVIALVLSVFGAFLLQATRA